MSDETVLLAEKMVSAVKAHVERALDAKVVDLEKRIAALESKPQLSYRGVWQESGRYHEGDVVTLSGGMWHANRSTTARPGTSDDYTLCVKAGRR